MQTVTSDTDHRRENHPHVLRHYSRSGEPPVTLIDADGTMRHNWRETYRRDEKNLSTYGRTTLDGSDVCEPFAACKRATINRLLYSRTIKQN